MKKNIAYIKIMSGNSSLRMFQYFWNTLYIRNNTKKKIGKNRRKRRHRHTN